MSALFRQLTFVACMFVSAGGCTQSPLHPPPLPAPAFQDRSDTLVALTASGNTTCALASSGKHYCWGGAEGGNTGEMFSLLDSVGQPLRLRSISPGSWSFTSMFCGLSFGNEILCTRPVLSSVSEMGREPPKISTECLGMRCLLPFAEEQKLPSTSIRSIAIGIDHLCIALANGTTYCAGRNAHAQIGNGVRAPDPQGNGGPVTSTFTRVKGGHLFAQLSANYLFTCGVTASDGAIYCWGYGQSGQTGDSMVMQSCSQNIPDCRSNILTRVLPESLSGDFVAPGNVHFVRVHAGQNLACGISTVGNVYCWGSNYRCTLGRCHSADSPLAHRISFPGQAVEIGAGRDFACARSRDRRVFCWGDNNQGQLGSAATVNADEQGRPPNYRDTAGRPNMVAHAYQDPCFQGGRCSPAPVEVTPGRTWAALAVGNSHACALSADDGGIYCWGGGDSTAFGRNLQLTVCETWSSEWPDTRCQLTPHRVDGLPAFIASPDRTDAHLLWEQARSAMLGVKMAKVAVSQEEMRVSVLVSDTTQLSDWLNRREREYGTDFYLQLLVDGVSSFHFIGIRPREEKGRLRPFTSFSELIAHSTADSGVVLETRNDTLLVILRDSTRISEMFGLRPQWFRWRQDILRLSQEYLLDSVPITYVDPQIPEPDSLLLARSKRERRSLLAEKTTVSRRLRESEELESPDLWLPLGDSAALFVDDLVCPGHSCFNALYPVTDSGWTVGDSSIIRLRIDLPEVSPGRVHWRTSVHLHASRLGKTTVSVRGLSSASDTIPRRKDNILQRFLTKNIIVIPPVSRVEISPRFDVAHVDEPVPVQVRVYDREGRVVPNVPVTLSVFQGISRFLSAVSDTTHVKFESPGKRWVVASFRGHADTVYVRVLEKRK